MRREFPLPEIELFGKGMIDSDVQKISLILWESAEPITREILLERLTLREWVIDDLEKAIKKGLSTAWAHQFILTDNWDVKYLEISRIGKRILEAIFPVTFPPKELKTYQDIVGKYGFYNTSIPSVTEVTETVTSNTENIGEKK